MNEIISTLNNFKSNGMTQRQGFEFFDKLEPVDNKFMVGKWRGEEIKSGHPMDGMLSIVPWRGKQFIDNENVMPLVLDDKKGGTYFVNPKNIFSFGDMAMKSKTIKKMINGEKKFNKYGFDVIFKRFKTNNSKARLRQVVYRGIISAAMIYDNLAIIDIFRKIDNDTVLGVMDLKGQLNDLGYFFILKRE